MKRVLANFDLEVAAQDDRKYEPQGCYGFRSTCCGARLVPVDVDGGWDGECASCRSVVTRTRFLFGTTDDFCRLPMT